MPLTWAGEISVLWPLPGVRVSSAVEEKQLNEGFIFQQTDKFLFRLEFEEWLALDRLHSVEECLEKKKSGLCLPSGDRGLGYHRELEGLRSPSQNRYKPAASYLTQYASLI